MARVSGEGLRTLPPLLSMREWQQGIVISSA